mgnify:CR=1 FL=1
MGALVLIENNRTLNVTQYTSRNCIDSVSNFELTRFPFGLNKSITCNLNIAPANYASQCNQEFYSKISLIQLLTKTATVR